MTMTAPNNIIRNSEHSASSTPSPHGFDRAVQSLGVALVNWSRARTERASVSHEEYQRLVKEKIQQQQRESDALHLQLLSGH